MGLDAVEVVMEVEAAFDIRIPDEAGQKIETVGQLYDYVVEQTRQKAADPAKDIPARTDVCLTAATFYLLRRELCGRFGLERRQVGPRESLEQLLPRRSRRREWAELAGRLELELPPLVRPRWVVALSALALAFSVLAIVVAGWQVSLGALVLMIAVRWTIVSVLTAPLANRFAPSITTVGDLCNVLLAYNYRRLVARFSTRAPSDVFQTIKTILVEQLGVHPALVTRDARLVGDLGLD
jgi:acyl carrier protein